MIRRNISVDQNVFEEFSSQCRIQNKTLFAFANQALSVVSMVSAEGGDPSDLYRLWHAVSILKQIDVVTLPSDFIDELIAKQYTVDKTGLLEKFRDMGSQLVSLLKIAAPDLDRLAELAKDFVIILPIKQFKITKTDITTVEIDIVGAGRRIESTQCTLEFVKSILNGYGYTPTKEEVSAGTLRIWAQRRGEV